jgi:hypothetical protein
LRDNQAGNNVRLTEGSGGFVMRVFSFAFVILTSVLGVDQIALSADAEFSGPSVVVYTVGQSYGLYDSNNDAATGANTTAFFRLSWVDGASVSDITVSGTLPSGISLQVAPFPVPNDTDLDALLGTPAAGSEGIYNVALNATVNGVLYTYPIKLVVEAATAAFATLPNGITGSWYGGPSQSGQGFSIEVLPNSTLLAQWCVFTPTGGQAWILGTGAITGNTATVQGYQVTGAGAVFPPAYNVNKVQPQLWGTLTLTFNDCNYGTVTWEPQVADYTSGGMAIERLTQPAGLSCP